MKNVMLHVTGIAPQGSPTPSRIYNDAQGAYSALVARRYNGNSTSPTKVLANDEIARLDQKLGEIKNIEDTKNKLLAKIDK